MNFLAILQLIMKYGPLVLTLLQIANQYFPGLNLQKIIDVINQAELMFPNSGSGSEKKAYVANKLDIPVNKLDGIDKLITELNKAKE
jgi:hypothetical protein